MSKIGSLIDPSLRQKLQGIAADLAEGQPAAQIEPAVEPEIEYVVTKASTDPNPPRPLTRADAIQIDPESEAFVDTLCIDCGVPLMIDPQLPKGVEDHPEHLRWPLCEEHDTIRARWAAINEQRNVEVIHRPQVKRHRPRTNDGVEHPVTTTQMNDVTTTQMNDTKEHEMEDLDTMSDADLGALVRSQMKSIVVDKVKTRQPKAKAKAAKAEKKAEKAHRQERRGRKNRVLPGFMVNTLEVPTLDLSEVSLDETANSVERQPYNKARFRLEGSAPLASPSACEEDGSLTPTTYRVLRDEHARLQALAEAKAASKASKKTKAKPVVAAMSGADDAVITEKAKALAKVTGLTKKQAREIVLASL